MKTNKYIKLGILLIILSGVSFAIMLLIPFLEIDNRTKVIGSSAAFIAMEILFWVGGILVGKELFTKYKARLNPLSWFKNRKQQDHL